MALPMPRFLAHFWIVSPSARVLEPDQIEVDVRGDLERGVQIDCAVDGVPGVLELDAADLDRATVADDLIRGDQTLLEGARRGDQLEGRTRWISALDRAVEDRCLRAVGAVEDGVGDRLGDHGPREDGRVEGGHRAEGEDLAGVDVHRDEAARQAEAADGALRRRLELRVEAQAQVVAGPRLLDAEAPAGGRAAGVDLNAGPAVDPPEQVVVGGLDPGLPDQVSGLQRLVLGLLQLVGVDLAHVAEQVRGERALRVAAHVDAVNAHPGELALVLAQVVDEVIRDVAPKGHRARRRLLGLLADLLLDPVDAHPGHRGQAPDHLRPRLLGLRELRGPHLKRKRRAVADKRLAVAIHDLPAGRLHGDLAHLVVVGLRQVAVAGEHLEVPEAKEDRREDHQGERAQDRDAKLKLGRAESAPPAAASEHHATPPRTRREGTPPLRRAGPLRRPRRRRRRGRANLRRVAGAPASTSAGRRTRRSSA